MYVPLSQNLDEWEKIAAASQAELVVKARE
jgi:hypothetical protein